MRRAHATSSRKNQRRCGPGVLGKSVEELYGTHAGDVSAVDVAVDRLVAEKLLLQGVGGVDDARDYKNRASMQSAQPAFSVLP